MAFNETIADRIRVYIGTHPRIKEKKMMGGLTFLLDGKMTIGVHTNKIFVRVLPEKEAQLLQKEHVEEMKFTGKVMKEFVSVAEAGFNTQEELAEWIELGIEHAESKLKTK